MFLFAEMLFARWGFTYFKILVTFRDVLTTLLISDYFIKYDNIIVSNFC